MSTLIFWEQETPIGEILVVSDTRGVHRIWFDGAGTRDAVQTAAFVGTARRRRDRSIAREIDEWFGGSREEFTLQVVWPDELTPFGHTVLTTLVERVPWGETVSYGELAELAGRPRAARAVGSIMAANPVPFVVPCHRVIAAGGRIGGYGGRRDAVPLKRWLLAREGVCFASQSSAARERAIPSKA